MIRVEKHPNFNIRDDIYKCRDNNKSPVWIYEEGAPREFRFICCEEHLKQVVVGSIEYLGEEFRKEILELVSPEGTISPSQMKDLESQVADYKTKYESELASGLFFKEKFYDMELELKKLRTFVHKQQPRKGGQQQVKEK